MKYTDYQIEKMAAPISQSEDERCKHAISMVRDALKGLNYTDDGKEIISFVEDTYSYKLELRQISTNKKITILVQDSYANKTNIPSESDVDVAVILESTFTTQYRAGASDKDYGFTDGTFSVSELKDEVFKALNHHFGYTGVERHDKSIKVIGNSYRVDADVVPAYRFRNYTDDRRNDPTNYLGGVEIRPDSGGVIINYPEQHIKLGKAKNKVTNYTYKKCVRIIKNIRDDMSRDGYIILPKISSFGLESLLWNVEVGAYNKYSSLKYVFEEVISFLKDDFGNFDNYLEANGIKSLFSDANTKLAYQNFITDVVNYYDYY